MVKVSLKNSLLLKGVMRLRDVCMREMEIIYLLVVRNGSILKSFKSHQRTYFINLALVKRTSAEKLLKIYIFDNLMTSIFNSPPRLCSLDTYCSRQQNQHAVFVDNWKIEHLSVNKFTPAFVSMKHKPSTSF